MEDSMERIQREQREFERRFHERGEEFRKAGLAAASKPMQTAHKNVVERAFEGAAITAVVVLGLILALVVWVAKFALAPAIVVGMLTIGFASPSWQLAWITSLSITAVIVGGIYAVTRSGRKTALVYAGLCVVFTAGIASFSDLDRADAFLFGRYWYAPRQQDPISTPSPVLTREEQQVLQQLSSSTNAQPTVAAASQPTMAEQTPAPALAKSVTPMAVGAPSPEVKASAIEPVQAPVAAANDPKPVMEAVEPGFDCAKASHPVEVRICANRELAALDRAMMEKYAASRSSPAWDNIRRDQWDWVKSRNGCGDDKCLEESYRRRIAKIEAIQKP